MPMYRMKTACLNCGIKDFISIPDQLEFIDYDYNSGGEPEHYSHYIIPAEVQIDCEEKHVEVNCKNCGLPFLCREFWDKSEKPNGADATKMFAWKPGKEDDGRTTSNRTS